MVETTGLVFSELHGLTACTRPPTTVLVQ